MKEKLTSKQKKFALEFLISGNITDAAKKAGYSERPARQIKLVVNLDSRTVLERLINTAKEMQMSNGQNVFELGR